MKTLKELSDKLEKFDNLPKEEKNNILELIDLKTELDMKVSQVIMEIKNLESKFNILLWVISAIGLMITVFKFIG